MKRNVINRELLALGFTPRQEGFYLIRRLVEGLDAEQPKDGTAEYGRLCGSVRGGREGAELRMRYSIRTAWTRRRYGFTRLFPHNDNPPSARELVLTLWVVLGGVKG